MFQFAAICFTYWKRILFTAQYVTKETLQQWAKRFTRDLKVDGVSVDFDGTVRDHLDSILKLKAKRLGWESLYNAVKAAGARRKSGEPFSEGQWRMALSRARKAETAKRKKSTPRAPSRSHGAFERATANDVENEFEDNLRSSHDADAGWLKNTPPDDVSPDDIAAVLSRLNRAK
jgi:hypothetical protein